MKNFRVVECGANWEHGRVNKIGYVKTEEDLKKGWSLDLKRWDSSLKMLNEHLGKKIQGEYFLKFEEVEEEKKMEKKDLIPGKHVVRLENGEYGVVIVSGIITKECGLHSAKIANNLTNSRNKTHDIVEVLEINEKTLASYIFGREYLLTSVWKREEVEAELEVDIERTRIEKKIKKWQNKLDKLKGE